jgi:ferredoxin-NADP reductase
VTDIMRGVVTSVVHDGGYTRHTVQCDVSLNITRPGQYVVLSCDGGQYHMTVSEQSGSSIQFITSATARLSSILSVGACVDISQPNGGFDVVDVAQHGRIVCIAAGSGIAGIIPIVDVFKTMGRNVSVLYLESQRKHLDMGQLPIGMHVENITSSGLLRDRHDDNVMSILSELGCTTNITCALTYICGSQQFIERFRRDIVPSVVDAEMFRTNQ